jgi:hypothetical protein
MKKALVAVMAGLLSLSVIAAAQAGGSDKTSYKSTTGPYNPVGPGSGSVVVAGF